MARILIVDDSELSSYITESILKRGGHTVVGVSSDGAEGLEKYKELRPDITTMDITMPVMNGMESLRKIMEFDPEAKVIMLSSSAQKSKIAEAFILGAFEFLPKPFDSEQLLEIVSKVASEI
jgi:two-component system chemotaxis response regulator CheY